MRKAFQFIALIVFVILLWNCQALKGPAAKVLSLGLAVPELDEPAPENRTADYDVRLTSLDGNDISMETMRGKVVFLNFWATWCAPCIAELPGIERLCETSAGDDIVFAVVSHEDPATVKKFLKKRRKKLDHYTIRQEAGLPAVYHTHYVPTTFILSKEGKIVHKSTGAFDWDDDKVIDYLKRLAGA